MKLFISYRRKSWPFAHHMADELRRHTGGEVFIDFQGIDEPNFVQSISRHLRESEIVILVVSEHTFSERIHDPNDWVRREIRIALDMRKPIILVCVDGLVPPENVPEDIIEILAIQGVMFYPDYFDAAMKRLIGYITKFLPNRASWQETTRLARPNGSWQAQFATHNTLEEALHLLAAGNHDKAIFLLEGLRDVGYKLAPNSISMERLLQYTRQQFSSRRHVDLRAVSLEGLIQFAYEERNLALLNSEARRAYQEIATMADDPVMISHARKAWLQFRDRFPDFHEDPANLRERLRPSSERPQPGKGRGTVLDLIESIIPVRDQTTVIRTGSHVPNLEFCAIPMGYTRLDERVYRVEAFSMAKYPITNAQYAFFLNASDGYANADWWNFSAEAWEWRRLHRHPQHGEFTGENHPRETVNWYDAMAFTRWLSYRTGHVITLPTEVQWQYAAQSGENRLYPWGNTFEVSRCNTYESNLRHTTPVNAYPNGVSRFGVWDMAGNVLEWCLNPQEEPALTTREAIGPRALRGGSWGYYAFGARITARYGDAPSNVYSGVGFRVVIKTTTEH